MVGICSQLGHDFRAHSDKTDTVILYLIAETLAGWYDSICPYGITYLLEGGFFFGLHITYH